MQVPTNDVWPRNAWTQYTATTQVSVPTGASSRANLRYAGVAKEHADLKQDQVIRPHHTLERPRRTRGLPAMNRDPETTIWRQTWNIRREHGQLPKDSLWLVEGGVDECIVQKVRGLCCNQLGHLLGPQQGRYSAYLSLWLRSIGCETPGGESWSYRGREGRPNCRISC